MEFQSTIIGIIPVLILAYVVWYIVDQPISIKDTRDITWLPVEEEKDDKETMMDHVVSYDATYAPSNLTQKERDEFFKLK